ncbi:cytochrome c biogenesis protein ResB [Corynebacterium sp. p3-SID1145]|uniref:cytochrome c biogenesis protein ResB n=1 Tax=unclassified Corynebacterium TaxID=2624378 RepID=UPI0021AAC272|nr:MULTISPECIES: cytochrome c biogenesis protein ResB [unclassified Corynebacterium]MCT1453171.1 cytochrome c biogenesis protein ResB [Corynebacterium sp. p3-SID1145]MCT1462282.1 cytochrome c biogenesis protein ResB [Corynebacterium sp. p3-SID1140]
MLNTATTWAKKLWHWLTSMRTALMLLFLLALIAVPGALLPQREISESQVNEYLDANPVMGKIYDKLMLFDVFSSPVFVALLTLLVISLVGCIIPRSVDHYKAYNAKPTRAPKYLHRMPHHASATTGMSVEEATARTERTLRKWRVAHYEPEEDRAGVLSISAERGYARELANLLFHISIVALIAIFAYGRMVFYEGQVIVVTNSESEYAVPVEQSREFCNTSPANFDTFRAGPLFDGTGLTPFCFISENFTANYLQNGQADSFSSKVAYADEKKMTSDPASWDEYTLRVNHPLRIGGDRVYLQGHGFAPQITVTWPNGETRTQMVQYRPTDLTFFLSNGVMRFDPPAGMYPDLGERRKHQLALEGVFAPTAQWTGPNGDMLQSAFPSMNDPAVSLDVYVGDAGLDTGRPQNFFALDQTLIANGQLERADRVHLAAGEEVEVPTGVKGPDGQDEVVKVRFDGAAEYANYQISRDPTQLWALVATVAMLGSLVGSLLIKRRRIWVRFTPNTETGGTTLEIAGLARTDRAGWGSEFDDVVDEILHGRSGSSADSGAEGAGTDAGGDNYEEDDDDEEEWH